MASRKDISESTVSDSMRQNICKILSANLTASDGTSGPDDLLQRTQDLLRSSLVLQEERRIQADEASKAFLEGKSRLVSDGEATLEALQSSLTQVAASLQSAAPFLGDLDDESLSEAEDILKEVQNGEMRIEYLKCLELFQDQCDRIRSSLACDSVSDAMAFLHVLVDWCVTFQSSRCVRLTEYLYDATIFWTGLVCDHVAQNLPGILNRIGFPRPPSVQKPQALSVDSRSRIELADIVMLLLRLRLPDFIRPSQLNVETPFLHDLMPMKYFVVPLEKRFRFHFFVSQKTNRLDKPEWYFTQLLCWIRDYSEFIGSLLQPVFLADGNRSVESDFALSLAMLGRSKFLSSLPSLLEDDVLFTHAMDEVLSFSRAMKNLGYESAQKTFCEILLLPRVFQPWFQAEKSLAENRVNGFLKSSSAWKCHYKDEAENPEDLKVPDSAQQFVTMLKGMTERYELLPSKKRQLEFLSLQLDCVESFNERLKLHYEENQDDTYQCAHQILPTLATSTKFVADSLEEISSTSFMVDLLSQHEYQSAFLPAARQAKDLTTRMLTITEECNRLARESYLMHLRNDTLDCVQDLLRDFAKQGWKSMPSVTEFLVPSMTPAMGELLYFLKTIISSQSDRLFDVLYYRYVSGLMEAIDRLLLEEVVYDNAFSTGGASQLKYDVVNNFIVVMSRLTHLPNGGLTRTVEACNILTINRGSAMLLAELLEENPKMSVKERTEDMKKTLKEMNLSSLKPNEVNLILRRRSDLDPI